MPAASLAAKCRLAWSVLRHLGPRWVLFRIGYAWRIRSSSLEKASPLGTWGDLPAERCWPLLRELQEWPAEAAKWGAGCVASARALAAGEWILFFHHRLPLGNPPNWRRNAFSDTEGPRGVHWSKLSDNEFGDIKGIWEINRFSFAFLLARAYARTRDDSHAELFWKLFEHWLAENAPNEGVNWKCGQESTFRLIATTFAVSQFQHAPATTPERMAKWSKFVVATGQRIAVNLDYAISQSNNHGVSECVGLITVGLLSDSKLAKQWLGFGLARLQPQLAELVYSDGGFSQHSLVYHRVLLDDLLWAIVLLRAAKVAVPAWLEGATRRALDFLTPLVDLQTGAAPLLGPNDGSNVLPLDELPYEDFRGVIQAGYALLDGARVLPPGPWDESAYWLTGVAPSTLPLRPLEPHAQFHAAKSGVFQWRSGDARLSFICPTRYYHRISQADMLHADVWWKGQPVTLDPGSYSYHSTGAMRGVMNKAEAHNVPMLAGVEPIKQVSKFLYMPWPRGEAGWTAAGREFRATHDAYGKQARIERAIHSPASGVFVVADRVTIAKPGKVRLHWLLADYDWRRDESGASVSAVIEGDRFVISWQGTPPPASISLVRAEEGTGRGWASLRYLALQPAVSLELLFDVTERLEFSTRFAVTES
jgi:hypothetical protein